MLVWLLLNLFLGQNVLISFYFEESDNKTEDPLK